MFAGDFFHPPASTVDDLSLLVSGDSALTWKHVGREKPPILQVHPWPSWLTRGSPRVVDLFLQFFYLSELSAFESCPGTCHICS